MGSGRAMGCTVFIDSLWYRKSDPAYRIRLVQIYRKDKEVMYEPIGKPGLKLLMKMSYLRECYVPEAIYIDLPK